MVVPMVALAACCGLLGMAPAVAAPWMDRLAVVPVQTGLAAVDWLIFLGGTVVVAGLIGVVESVMARLRLPSIPRLLMGAGVLSLLSLALVLVLP